ncbi:MAG: DUF4236 domain-containing protein [Sphaerochaeta sp.]
MGVRFHRSIKIANGVRLNISKSGLGVSLGPRGAKVSFGPNGVYSNFGIPGSGLSVRKKLDVATNRQNTSSYRKEEVSVDVRMSIDEESGKEEITVSRDGVVIDDSRLLRKIKSEEKFKEKLREFRLKSCDEINDSTQLLINLHKHSSQMPDWDRLLRESKEKRPERYFKRAYPVKKPELCDVIKQLTIEANEKVNSMFFKSRKRKEYVEKRKESYLKEEIEEWDVERDKFERQEIEKEKRVNESNRVEFEKWLNEVELTFNPTVDFLIEKLNQYLHEIKMPVDFSVSFDVIESGKKIYLDIDLPEIEDYPKKKARILASGKVSVKDKSMKDRKGDYIKSIAGMSIYFASVVFSISPVIDEVVVSGFTQRVNKASGNIEDEYVYSVRYEKEKFYRLNVDNIEPELTLKSFSHRMKTTAQNDLRVIEPFEV